MLQIKRKGVSSYYFGEDDCYLEDADELKKNVSNSFRKFLLTENIQSDNKNIKNCKI